MMEYYNEAMISKLCVNFPVTVISHLITSLAKEVMFLVALVCLFVCLFVCEQHYSKSYEQIGMTFYGGVLGTD